MRLVMASATIWITSSPSTPSSPAESRELSVPVERNTYPELRTPAENSRNAVAHGRIKFSSDSRDPREVIIDVEDCKAHQSTPYWAARMTAAELREFCFKLMVLWKRPSGRRCFAGQAVVGGEYESRGGVLRGAESG